MERKFRNKVVTGELPLGGAEDFFRQVDEDAGLRRTPELGELSAEVADARR
jgi:hypothetical protein